MGVRLSGPGARTVLLLWAAVCAGPAAAESRGAAELSRWLSSASGGSRYRDVGSELSGLVSSADTSGYPSIILVQRIMEGGAKGATAQALVAAAGADLERLSEVSAMLAASSMAPAAASAQAERAYGTLSLCLRAGLEGDAVASVLEAAGRSADALDRALAACETMLTLRGVTRLADGELTRLAGALVASRVPAAAYSAVTAAFVKGRAGRLDDGEVLDLVTATLERGGGVIQINAAVEAESRGRSRTR